MSNYNLRIIVEILDFLGFSTQLFLLKKRVASVVFIRDSDPVAV